MLNKKSIFVILAILIASNISAKEIGIGVGSFKQKKNFNRCVEKLEKNNITYVVTEKNNIFNLIAGPYDYNQKDKKLNKFKKIFDNNVFVLNWSNNNQKKTDKVNNKKELKRTKTKSQKNLGLVMGMNIGKVNNKFSKMLLNNTNYKYSNNTNYKSMYIEYPYSRNINFGIELSHINSIDANIYLNSIEVGNTKFSYSKFNIDTYIRYMYPLGLFDLYTKVGISNTKEKISINIDENYKFNDGTSSYTNSKYYTNPFLALGFNTKLNNRYSLDVEYNYIYDIDLEVVKAGVRYKF